MKYFRKFCFVGIFNFSLISKNDDRKELAESRKKDAYHHARGRGERRRRQKTDSHRATERGEILEKKIIIFSSKFLFKIFHFLSMKNESENFKRIFGKRERERARAFPRQ